LATTWKNNTERLGDIIMNTEENKQKQELLEQMKNSKLKILNI